MNTSNSNRGELIIENKQPDDHNGCRAIIMETVKYQLHWHIWCELEPISGC